MRGIAPKANLISVKILDNKGKGNINNVYEAAIWLRKNKSRYNIKVANFSIGAPVYESQSDISLLKEAINIISDEEITMYLVEVCIYHEEYNFIKTDDLLDVISNPSEIDFFKENFVDYMIYKNASQSFIFNNILTLLNLLVYYGFSIQFSETILLSLLILIVCGYYAIGKYIVPKFVKYLMKYKVSINTMNNLNYLSFFLLAFILIKTYVL
jgi:hypothetical protein